MSDLLRRAYESAAELAEGERALVATITTDAVDRYREVILPRGIDLAAYRKNPVVIWGHDTSRPPVGRCQWIKANDSKRGLIAKVQFAETEAAEEVWQLYRQGFLKAFSIGARTIEGAAPTPAEIKARPDLAGVAIVWKKIELIELSCVAVGANPEALIGAVAKGLALSDGLRRDLGVGELPPGSEPTPTPAPALPDLPPLVGRTFRQAHAAVLRSVRLESPAALARRLLTDEVDRLKGKV